MKKYINVLQCCDLFAGMSEENILAILGCLGARAENFEKDETVFFEGDTADRIGVVLEGTVLIEQSDYFGNRSIVSKLSASELFGETFACAGTEKIPVEVVAAEKSRIMLIDSRRITQTCCNACSFHQQIIYNLIHVLAVKNLQFYKKIDITSKRSTREKLLTYLNYEAKRAGKKSFVIPFDRQALADYLGVERSGLSVEIGKLKKEGILCAQKNRFTLK